MNSPEISALRQMVLDLYPRYKNIVKEIDASSDTEVIDQKIDYLRQDKFMLAIAGESKSGKSKFINALIGHELLPTDVLQCTSGIVEISKSSNLTMQVRYASGKQDVISFSSITSEKINDLKNNLAALAAIPEEFRKIPFIQINDFLIAHSGAVTQEEIEREIADKWNEISSLTPATTQLVYDYIEQYRSLDKIPVDIRIGFPLEFDFETMSIVDTPGVNARGGVESITYDYIMKANAIVFIHTLKNIDSKSLHDFIKKNLPKGVAKNVFLFLTHKFPHPEDHVKRVIEQAISNYPEVISERIIAVDSMLKLIYHDYENGLSTKEIRADEEKFNMLARYLVDFDSDVKAIKEGLFKDSNFEQAFSTLNAFSNQARQLQIEEITDILFGDYERYELRLKEDIRLRESKLTKSPSVFEAEIAQMNAGLKDFQTKLRSFSRELAKKFKQKQSLIEFRNSYRTLINQAKSTSEFRKILDDFNYDCNGFIQNQANLISTAYTHEINKLGADLDTLDITAPHIDLSKIEIEAKKGAYELIAKPVFQLIEKSSVEVVGFIGGVARFLGKVASNLNDSKKWNDGTNEAFAEGQEVGRQIGQEFISNNIKYEYDSVLNETKYMKNFQSTALGIIDNVTDGLEKSLEDYFDNYSTMFSQQLEKLIDDKTNALNELSLQKKSEDQIREEIGFYEDQQKRLLEQKEVTLRLKKTFTAN